MWFGNEVARNKPANLTAGRTGALSIPACHRCLRKLRWTGKHGIGPIGSAGQHPRQMPYFSRLSTLWSVTRDLLPLCVTLGRPSDDRVQPFGAIKDIEVC